MSEENPTPATEEATPSLADLMMGVVSGPDSVPDTSTGSDEQEATPENPGQAPAAGAEEPAQPAADAQEPPAAADVPTWENQEAAGRAFREKNARIKELEDALAREAAEKAYLAGLAEGRTPQQPATAEAKKPDADPEPDPEAFPDDQSYYRAVREWDRREAARDAEAKLAPVVSKLEQQLAQQREIEADRAWASSMAVAQAKAGDSWTAVTAYVNHLKTVSPGFEADLNAAADPGAFALQAFQLAHPGAQFGRAAAPASPATPTPAPAAKPAPTSIEALLADPTQREALLRHLAAEKAAKGEVPQVPPGPRGVGSGPGAQGVADGITVEAIRATGNPEKLRELQGAAVAGWLTDGEFVG